MAKVSSEPSVHFFEDPLGHRVAYAVHGEGPPLVCTAWWVSHVESDWENAGFRRFFSTLAEHHTVIRYDRPGAGLSDRERGRVDLASEVATLTGLLDHLELERTSLLGIACAGPPSICVAASQPQRVSHLVLFGSYVDGRDVGSASVRDALQKLVRAHWGLGARALTDLFAPDLDAEERNALSEAQRRSASAEMSAKLLALTFDIDVRHEARRIDCPTLVIHRRHDQAIPFAAGRELAATLPGATLQSLEGREHVPWYGDVDAAAAALLAFLGDEERPARQPAADERVLAHEGELWKLRFDGKEIFLADARGLADLATLLARPGEEVHVARLYSGGNAAAPLEGADPVLDDAAIASYRNRLEELEQEIDKAKADGAAERREKLLSEREELAHELSAALGRGGRKRQLNAVAERARKAVTARIRASLKKIAAAHPELGRHLDESVSTGLYCSYSPVDGAAFVVR